MREAHIERKLIGWESGEGEDKKRDCVYQKRRIKKLKKIKKEARILSTKTNEGNNKNELVGLAAVLNDFPLNSSISATLSLELRSASKSMTTKNGNSLEDKWEREKMSLMSKIIRNNNDHDGQR